MIVGVSGAGGQMGRLVTEAISTAGDLELGPLYDPAHVGEELQGAAIGAVADAMADADVVVEFTHPDVVMLNLETWRQLEVHAVVGTSGFSEERLADVARQWEGGPPNCLIVPNFSVGAVVAMRLAETAAPHFAAAEVIELHHDRKADAPSGTALTTAERIAAAAEQHRQVESAELVDGARGADVGGVPVHAVRLPGLVADLMVVFGGPGETLTIRHATTDRSVFLPGVLAAVRGVADLVEPVSVGLDAVLDL